MLPPPRPAPSASAHPDDAIRSTDDDAAASRLSAVSLGYLDDPFVSLLYRPQRIGRDSSSTHKPPLINIGTHHRTAALDAVVDSFLSASATASRPAQIVSLGAGSDTRFWRLAARQDFRLGKYVEVDFPHLTSVKAQRIAKSKVLVSALGEAPPAAAGAPMAPPAKPYKVGHGGTSLSSERYTLLPVDLRTPGALDQVAAALDPDAPTLVISECVFCYMEPEASREVLAWFGSRFENVASVVYEMCGLNDAFGAVMKRNLAARNLSLPGALPFPTAQSQAERFLDPRLGDGVFTKSGAKSLWSIRSDVVSDAEQARISKLEFLDEIEELRLVLSHYVVAWGTKGSLLEGVGL
ncbi:carboxy methyl transferase for protein phosphatase 2A [Vanrija albida]|uniref:Leucine carboxyl methyltransferase 1 n=1 Tax=Vanrija albida TaxID=181172 RepID=A0ABR3Q2T2_9TREE